MRKVIERKRQEKSKNAKKKKVGQSTNRKRKWKGVEKEIEE